MPPLLATASTGQRNIVTEQLTNAVPVGTPVVLSTRPVQQVTQIRIQTQPAANSLQRRGLALTVNIYMLLKCTFEHEYSNHYRENKCWRLRICSGRQTK